MSQPLGRLRNHFDDPILVRVGRHMQLTPFARGVAEPLRDAIRGLEAVLAKRPGFDPAQTPRRFVLVMVDHLSLVLLPALRAHVAEDAPHVDLAVHTLDAASIAPSLEDGAVALYPGVLGETEHGFHSERLYVESFQVLTRRGHPLHEAPSAEAYASWPHVHVSPRREPGSIVDRALAALDLERRIAVEIPYFGLLPELLEESDLVATVPGRLARRLAARRELAVGAPPVDLPDLGITSRATRAPRASPASRGCAGSSAR